MQLESKDSFINNNDSHLVLMHRKTPLLSAVDTEL